MGDLVYLAIIADPTMSDKQRQKEREYKKYVDGHREFVAKAWKNMKAMSSIIEYLSTITDNVNFLLATVDTLINAHDMSKYKIEEWEPYRKNFYPVNEEEKENNIADYQKAWKHHYMVNLHHWDYWHNTDSVDKMSIEFVLEMCCDWIAMSMRFGGTAYKWYIDNKKDIVLGDKQTDWVTNILKIYYNIK